MPSDTGVRPEDEQGPRPDVPFEAAMTDDSLGDPSAFKAASLSTIRWASLARVVSEVVTVGSAVVLARLISPAEFGRVAIALGIATTALALTWGGLGSALVQKRSIEADDMRVATMISIVAGAVVTVIVLSLSFVVGPVLGYRVAFLLRLVSPIFLLSAMGSVPNAMLQRRLAFRRLSQVDMVTTVVGPLTAIAFALAGLGAEAIVLGALVSAALGTVLSLMLVPPVRPAWDRRKAREFAGFGTATGLTFVAYTLYTNIDYAILGARLTPRAVGNYWRGYQLGIEYQGKISSILLRVAFPLYSRAPGIDEMRALRGKIVRVHTLVLYPFLITLIASAPEAIQILFGSQWHDAVFPTQVLAVAGMAAVAAAGAGQLALAEGHARALLNFNVVALTGYIAVVYLASGYGLKTVVVAVCIYHTLFCAAQLYVLEMRLVGIPVRDAYGALVPALVASAVSLAVAYPFARLLEQHGTPNIVVVAASGLTVAALYASTVRLVFRGSWDELTRFVRAFLRRG